MTELTMCIHGHFYQPPRENPFTGLIPPEPGAEPFENFNEKIHSECYRPNAELGNFELISFNFGPTLAHWLEAQFPVTHDRIVMSDKRHRRTFGVGNGMAQAYNHTILPLARHRDKATQIRWGIADFAHRFGHAPEGMWLPEMAADIDTLAAMQSLGLRYTLLCPHQVRYPNGDWVDSRMPHYVRLSDNRYLTVFLRDEQMSNRLAFDPGLTASAAHFADWCRDTAHTDSGLFIIATDGETFGHHQHRRQHFLRSLLRTEAGRVGFQVTTPGGYLRRHSPTREVVLVEQTAWSCAHGLARWNTGCACTSGDQRWKPRLRTAFDRLAGSVDALYENECRAWIDALWELRDGYINVMLGIIEGPDLLRQFSSRAIPTEATRRLLHLLEAERYCQATYTSCGLYFEDLGRIETRNNIAYASMSVDQVKLATGLDLSPGLRSDLAAAKSWVTHETGQDIYDNVVAHRRA